MPESARYRLVASPEKGGPINRQHTDHEDPPEDDRWQGDPWDGPPLWAVTPEEVRRLVAAYRDAIGQAQALTAGMGAAGLGAELVSVGAGVDAAGRPTVHAVITFTGARRLADLLAAGGPPPAGIEMEDGAPPWAI